MSSTHSSDPLLSPASPTVDSSTPTDGYFGSRRYPQDVDTFVAGQQPAQSYDMGHSYSPRHSFSSSPPSSEAEWGSETHSEENPLLRSRSPPPSYDVVDPIYATRRAVAENQSNSGSASHYGAPKGSLASAHDPPRPLIDIDVDPQESDHFLGPYSEQGQQQSRDRKFQQCRRRLPKPVLVLGALVLFGLGTVLILWCRGVFGRVCLAKDFVSRDYQIQSLEHFDFSNTDEQNSGLPRGFKGLMHVRSGPSDQAVDLNVSIRSRASDLRGGNNGSDWRPSRLVRCAEVTLYFRPGLEITNLRIASKKVKLVLSSDLVVTGTTTISLKKGNLVSENFGSSRETFIDVESSTVRGNFSLRDVLSIRTRSGSVSIDIHPKPVFKDQPKPALLEIISRSGSVNINYPGDEADIPDREYRSAITSRSGSVSGKFLHGKDTTIEIRSGNLDAKILPYGLGENSSTLTTNMESGSSTIELLRPGSKHGSPLTRLSSSHSAKAGQLNLKYPDEWQGKIFGTIKSGNFHLGGRDVEIIEQRNGPGGQYVHAEKGHGKSELKFEISSGSVDATVGE